MHAHIARDARQSIDPRSARDAGFALVNRL